MKTRILFVPALALLPVVTFGQDATRYECSYGELQRRVEILYETGGTLPCEVHYYKDSEAPGESQVLWRAMNQAGYCEQKAEAFITKLQGMGWSCGAGTTPAAPTAPQPAPAPQDEPAAPLDPVEPAEIDDTEALAPVEDDSDTD
jgi:hypothetical protein